MTSPQKLPEFVSSNDICKAMGFSKRTLQRRFHRPVNPLPQPCIKSIGAASMWEVSIAQEWIERERNCANNDQPEGCAGGEQ